MREALDRYRAALSGGELLLFPITALDRTGVPTWSTTLLAPDGRALANGVGYGIDDLEAQVSALGEATEDLCAARAVPELPRVRGTYAALAARGAVDPLSLCLPAGSPYDGDTELTWLPGRRWRTGEEVLLPLEAVASSSKEHDAPGEPLFTPITNGLGAGDTLERAILHGLLEIVQRDGNSVSQRALDTGVRVAGADEPALRRLDDELGIDVLVKAAECDLGMANVFAVGAERDPSVVPFAMSVTGSGEAAHPDRARAIRKAVLEFTSSRVRKAFMFGPAALVARVAPPRYLEYARTVGTVGDEPRALEAMRTWLALDAAALRERIADPVLAVRETIPVEALPDHGGSEDPAEALAFVLERLAGFDVLWTDLSPPDGGVRAVKVVVPGLEVETASYGRIGERNLRRLLDRDSPLVGLGAPPPGAAAIRLPEGEAPAWLHVERLRATVGELYALYREPYRHATL